MSIGLELFMSEDRVSFHFLKWFIPLPIKPWRELRDICESWGISYSDRALFLRWGTTPGNEPYPNQGQCRSKLIWMPWDFGSNVRYEVQIADGSFVKAQDRIYLNEGIKDPDHRFMYTAPYTYKLKSGIVQNVTATFYVEEREWRWRVTHKLPFRIGPKILNRCISITFSDEVGERTGSWKGGCTGCGYLMLPGETALDTLRRMERERKF